MIQHITLAEVKSACLKAYSEGTLLAQNVISDTRCYYFDGRFGCAIGVALSDEVRQQLYEDQYINGQAIQQSGFERLQKFFTWNEQEVFKLSQIQGAHDNWLYGDVSSETIFVDLISEEVQ